ncbi:hypothetical protein SNOG_15185 [Parastagonospora nodorum SN15]|uniref:Uncharacterized protein n=1 Tax=Phaeosphaeria nodorum (strain SN15 / ATCC MYA-4574 / FGSC 10173) TaxID=321614 RepID=Q0TZ60_PHANO|nr:hypothetical protein SNOG_15185 [Parastagonospora nodorum SN15]EAT77410.1 hypothetical protein SNOG_15185 [Parastagonospora nodorum SN15]
MAKCTNILAVPVTTSTGSALRLYPASNNCASTVGFCGSVLGFEEYIPSLPESS